MSLDPPHKITLIHCREVGDLIMWRCGKPTTNTVDCPRGVPCPALTYSLSIAPSEQPTFDPALERATVERGEPE